MQGEPRPTVNYVLINVKFIPLLQIRKVDCSRRPDSVCCESQSVAEGRLDVVEEEEDYNETGDEDDARYKNGDNLIQIASNIHEVVVKPNGDPVALQHNNDDTDPEATSSTTATTLSAEVSESTSTEEVSKEKKIPKFCLKLKFNCKLLSFHPCCRHQVAGPSTSSVPKSTLVKVKQEKVKEPKKVQQQTATKIEEEGNVKNEVKETVPEKKPFFSKRGKNKSSSSLFSNNLRKKSSLFANPVKKSLFSNKRKPGKSGLCKIINCSRNKSHFCCQPDDEVSEVEEKVEAEVVTEAPKKKDQIDAGEDKPQDNFNVDKNHVENASEGPSSAPKQTALESVTDEDDKVEDEDEITTMMTYGNQDEEEQTTTTGTVINESDDEDSGETLMSQEQSLDPHEADYDNNTESSTEFDELTTMMSYDGFTQMDEEDNTEAQTESQTTEISTEIPNESFEEVTMVSKSKSESYEETRIWYDGINEKGEFVEKKKDDKPYHVYQDANGETVVQVYPVYVPKQSLPVYNDIDNEIDNSVESERAWYREDRDTGDIINEITCEHVDCLAWPGNKCCSPHVTKKRHSHEEDEINDKITATIVRIVKSVRWV